MTFGRLVAGVILVVPLLMVVAGLYILVATPDVVTATTTYAHSHGWGFILVLLGAVFGLVSGMLAVVAS